MKQVTEAELRIVFENPKVYHPSLLRKWPDTGQYCQPDMQSGWRHTVRVLKDLGILVDG